MIKFIAGMLSAAFLVRIQPAPPKQNDDFAERQRRHLEYLGLHVGGKR